MYLIKNKIGTFSPVDNTDYEENKKIAPGTVVKVSPARNWQFQKKAFALLKLGFSNQDKYTKFEIYRKVITCRAGYYDDVEIVEGEVIPQAHSLSYESMSAEVFEKWYNDTLDVISTDMQTAPERIKQELEGFY